MTTAAYESPFTCLRRSSKHNTVSSLRWPESLIPVSEEPRYGSEKRHVVSSYAAAPRQLSPRGHEEAIKIG